MVTNFVNNQNSSKNQRSNSTTFDIRNFIDQLNPAQEKGKYICPVCSGHNLSIDEKTGKYQCFNGCECRDIREAIRPWAEVVAESKVERIPRAKSDHKQKPKLVNIPTGELKLVRLAESATDSPLPQKPQFIPKGVPNTAFVIIYSYSETQTVHRFQWRSDKNPKGHEKTFRQCHINEDGMPQWSKGDEPWDAYRLNEALAALKNTSDIPVLLTQEGEGCVEEVRKIGLASITWQGSSWGIELDCAHRKIKTVCPNTVIAFLKDNDETGEKKACAIKESCDRVGLPCIIIDPLAIYPNLGDKDDVVQMLAGMDTSEFIRRLESEIHRSCDEKRNQKSDIFELDIPDAYDPDVEFLQIAKKTLYGDKPWISTNDKLYYWTGTHYKHSSDSVQRPRIAAFCNCYPVTKKGQIRYPYANPASVRKVLQWVKDRLEVDPDLLNPPGLNCTNGVLQLHWVGDNGDKPEFELIPHNPELYYTYEPLVDYKPDADTTDCDRMLECLDPPQREIFLRTIAASLDLATVRRHKGRLVRGLLLKGDGNNGKDTLREAVSLMYGGLGLTSCTLSDFKAYDDGRKFPLSRLKVSRVNWASENANTAALDKLQSIKAFLTGDTLSSEGKGKDELDYTPAAVGLFNVNDTPNLKGTLEAIASRWGILSFTKTFKIGADPTIGEIEADPRFKYDPKFMRTQLLPAFLNRILQALVDLMRFGIDYSCTLEALSAIQVENSHLFLFCRDTGLRYDHCGNTTAGEIWQRLEQWYQDNGTLTYEEGSNGKRKAIWVDQVKKSDTNVKGANQVIAKFQVLFPKAKRVTVGKGKMALQGISFAFGEAVEAVGEPMVSQPTSLEALSNKEGEPVTPISNPHEKNEKTWEMDLVEINQKVVDPQELTQLAHYPGIVRDTAPLVALPSESPAPQTASPAAYSPSPDDPEAVEGNVENIRTAIAEMSWEMILALTEAWTNEFKKAVWQQLSPEDKKAVEFLATDAKSPSRAAPAPEPQHQQIQPYKRNGSRL